MYFCVFCVFCVIYVFFNVFCTSFLVFTGFVFFILLLLLWTGGIIETWLPSRLSTATWKPMMPSLNTCQWFIRMRRFPTMPDIRRSITMPLKNHSFIIDNDTILPSSRLLRTYWPIISHNQDLPVLRYTDNAALNWSSTVLVKAALSEPISIVILGFASYIPYPYGKSYILFPHLACWLLASPLYFLIVTCRRLHRAINFPKDGLICS